MSSQNLSIYLLFLAIGLGFSLDISNNRVDLIENGWIELVDSFKRYTALNRPLSSGESLNFVAKCNRNYVLNSNTSQVLPIKFQEDRNGWTPLNGYLISGLSRLCVRLCVFQSSLSNGFMQIRASTDAQKGNNLKVYENSKIAFKCFHGYQLRTISYKMNEDTAVYDVKSTVHKVTAFMEKCGREGIVSKHWLNENNESDKSFHQCFKYCSLFQTDFSEMNGFLVPLRRVYLPGEQLKLMCNEGYIAELATHNSDSQELKETKLNNTHTFECSTNGTWQLVDDSKRSNDPRNTFFESGYSNTELKELAKCSSMSSYLSKQEEKLMKNKNQWFSSSLSNIDFNIRTLLMLFVISASIIVLLITSIATLRFYNRKQRHSALPELYSPQLDPLLLNYSSGASDFRTRPQTVSRSQIQQRNCAVSEAPIYSRICSTSDLNRINASAPLSNPNNFINAYLPSYEEALLEQPRNYNQANFSAPIATSTIPEATSTNQQPCTSSSASNKNELVINETTSIIEIAPSTLQSLGLGCQGSLGRTRSRSGSIRSNLTARSSNSSNRNNNSAGTAITTASFNLLPPTTRHKNGVRARRHQNFKYLSNHRGSNRGNSSQNMNTQSSAREAGSCIRDNNTQFTGATDSSIFSNESNTNVVNLRNSLVDVDTIFTNGGT